jgi:hypothetical protein
MASSVPYEVTASVRRNESLIIRGKSMRIGGRDSRKDLRKGEKYNSKCTKLKSTRLFRSVIQVCRKKCVGRNKPRSLL